MEHSKNFKKVMTYYKNGLEGVVPSWSLERVRAAVHKWITPAEYELITGEPYEEG